MRNRESSNFQGFPQCWSSSRRGRIPATTPVNAHEIAKGSRVIGLESDGPAIRRDRLVELPLVLQSDAEIVVGLGAVRFQGDDLPMVGNRLVQSPLDSKGLPSIAKGFGPVGPQGEGPPDQIHRHIRPPTLEVEGSQEFKSLGMTRLPIQNLAIDPLGLRQPPGLVVPDRCLHCLPALRFTGVVAGAVLRLVRNLVAWRRSLDIPGWFSMRSIERQTFERSNDWFPAFEETHGDRFG